MTAPVPFGPLEGFLAVRPEAVTATVYRGTDVVTRSRDIRRTYAAVGSTIRIALEERADEERWGPAGHEPDADFRGLVLAKVVADGSVQEADGLEIVTTAPHHAGRKFHVVAVRDPQGRHGRLFLREDPGADWGS